MQFIGKELIPFYSARRCLTWYTQLHVVLMQVSATKLFEIEAELKAELKCWSDEKDDRLKEMTELQRIEKSVCDCLLTTPMYIPTGTIPTRETLTSLREHTDKLASEKVCQRVMIGSVLLNKPCQPKESNSPMQKGRPIPSRYSLSIIQYSLES